MTEQTIFLSALDLPPDQRSTYLDSACAGNAALRREVEALLAAHAKSGLFLDEPAVEQLAAGRNTATADVHAPAGPDTPTLTSPDSAPGGATDLAFLKPSTRPGSIGRLAHYEVLEVLGRGGFGTVLRAFDDRLHRVVAIKVLSPQLAASGPARQRFYREAKAGAAIRDEHVVGIHAVSDPTEPVPYLVMEYIGGQTLQQKIDRTGPLSVPEILRIGSQIAKGLAAAHATGLIHRDVKPSNILLENGVERVKITDFGLARTADDASISHSGLVAGTPMYMAPEQAHGGKIDHRADLFSLGSVLYAMCTGHPPFRATTTMAVLKRVCEADPRPVREVNPEVPDGPAGVIGQLHAKRPEDRFQTAKEVADQLQQHLAHWRQPDLVPPPAVVSPPSPRRWQAGDRVLAPWEPEWLYPATVQQTDADSVLVAYDEGDSSWLDAAAAAAVRPLDIDKGARVFGWWNGPYYPGTVTEREGDRVHIAYDDGDREWTDLSYIRVAAAWAEVRQGPDEGKSGRPAPPRRGRKRRWLKVGVLTLLAGLLAVGFVSRTVQDRLALWSGKALLTIEEEEWAVAQDVEVHVKAHGRVVAVLNSRSNRRAYLEPGNYTLTCPNDNPRSIMAVGVGPAEIQLRSGERQTAVVRAVPTGMLQLEMTPETVVTFEPSPRSRVSEPESELLHGRATYLFLEGDYRLTARRADGATLARAFSIRAEREKSGFTSRTVHIDLRAAFADPSPPAADGFVSLFNGKDLTGWKKLPGDKGQWRVEDGALVGTSSKHSHLFTARGDYENFHLRVQMRLGDGTTGIGVRAQEALHFFGLFPTGYRVWLDSHGSTSLMAYPGEDTLQKSAVAPIPPDAWVTVEAIARGSRLQVLVDGVKAVDVYDNEFGRGHIALTADDVAFRRIEIKELPPPPPEEVGWQSLFNGADLQGWTAVPKDPSPWSVTDGVLRGAGKGLLYAHRREYADFHLRAVARVNDGGSGDILFRTPRESLDQGRPRGYDARINATIQNALRTGSLEDTFTHFHTGKDPLVKPGEWFTYEVIAQGYRIQLKVNGQTTLDWTDGNRQRSVGHLALQVAGRQSVVEFKAIEVKVLSPSSPDAAVVKALRDLVAAKERQLEVVKADVAAGKVRNVAATIAEIDVLEARIRLAEGERQTATVIALLEQLLAKREEEKTQTAALVTAGHEDPEALAKVTVHITIVNARLAKARSPGPTPVRLRSFTPGTDPPPLPHRGPAGAVTVAGDAWRIENATDPAGNFHVMVAQDLSGLPKDGVLVLRARVKVEGKAKDKTYSCGALGFGGPNQVYASWDQWPDARARYDGHDTEWTEKEARYPAAEVQKKAPSVYLCAGLHDKGVLWLKDVELLHLPAATDKPAAPLPPPAARQPIKLRAFTPGKDPLPLPHRGPAKAVTVDGGAWRIENAGQGGNYNVMVVQDLDGLPKDGVLVFRAKVKVEARDKLTWGDLGFGAADQVFISWGGWPDIRARYDGHDTEWTEKEVRYPAAEVHKKDPPTVYLYAGLHAGGVLWLKDVELLHLPAEMTAPGKQ